MPRLSLHELQVGCRYTTSKIARLEDLGRVETHGFHGEAIASIAEVSTLKIDTQAEQSTAAMKSWNYGKEDLLSQTGDRTQRGTTVRVSDLFGNVPVRQKAAHHELVELDRVRQEVQRLALVHSHVGFVLFDVTRDSKLIQTQTNPDLLAAFESIFGSTKAAALAHHELPDQGPDSEEEEGPETKPRVPMFVEPCALKPISVSGLLSRPSEKGMTRKDLQFVYANRRPVACTLIQQLINQIYAPLMKEQSKHASSGDRAGLKIREQVSVIYPSFVVNISCDPSLYDVVIEDGKSAVEFTEWPRVLECIHRFCASFLESIGYSIPKYMKDSKQKPPRRKVQIDATAILENKSQSDLASIYTTGPSW